MWNRTLAHYELLNCIVSRFWADWTRCQVLCCLPVFICCVQLFPDRQTALALSSLQGKHTHFTSITVQWCMCVEVSRKPVCVFEWFEILLFHLLTQHLNLAGNNIACFSQLCPSFSLACSLVTAVDGGLPSVLSPHLVSPGHIDWSLHDGNNTCPRDRLASSVNESILNRNIVAILFSFHSLLIILLAHAIQEWPDKSAAQWAAWWRGSSGVWMALASVMFQRAVALFSAV